METTPDVQALEQFILNNPLLPQLEEQLDEFNIFEAAGIIHQELRHSNFLAFLMNPRERHGLGDYLLKRFLIHVLSHAENAPISPLRIDVIDLDEATVERETHHIDILMYDDANKIVCVIENKVFSGEHSNQLNRYRKAVENRFPADWVFLYIFLTPDGDTPQQEDSPYMVADYGTVADIIEQTARAKASVLGADVKTMMIHYVTLIRRYIVSDSDIAKLCQDIYRAHKHAIDLIIKHIPDRRREIANYLADMLSKMPELGLLRTGKQYISFYATEWDAIPELNCGMGWGTYEKCIYIEFVNFDNSLFLSMVVGPVKPESERVDFRLLDVFAQHGKLFNRKPRRDGKWRTVYTRNILREKDYDGAELDDLTAIIDEKWDDFVNDDLPRINQVLAEISFEGIEG